MLSILIGTASLLLQPAMPPIGQRTVPLDQVQPQLDVGAGESDPLILAAAAHPLGSDRNPIRVGGPEGAQAYLARLRCADGASPRILDMVRRDGPGAFGSVVTAYRLDCGAAAPGAPTLILDLYHAEHVETRPAAGFSIVD
jgi:hypothetical protein